MTGPACEPLMTLVPPSAREEQPDRLAELLECLADLVVEAHRCRGVLERLPSCADQRVQDSIAHLEQLERNLRAVGVEAASVHQGLLRERLL